MLDYLYTSLGYVSDSSEFKSNHNGEKFTNKWKKGGTYTEFDQREFFEGVDWNSEDFKDRQNGLIYIPNNCSDPTS
jgi:hypothetical protein